MPRLSAEARNRRKLALRQHRQSLVRVDNPRSLAFGLVIPVSEYRIQPRRGEKHGGSRLSGRQVRDIINMKGKGFKQSDVAHLYGVHQSRVCRIWNGKSWSSNDTEGKS
jgi:hypothetical protein